MNMPKLATGKWVPVTEQEIKAKKEEYLRKKQYRHDWKIAIFGVVGGAASGFVSSLIFWLIQK